MVILNMKFEAAADPEYDLQSFKEKSNQLRNFLNERTDGCDAVFEELKNMMDRSLVQNLSKIEGTDDVAKYLEQYLKHNTREGMGGKWALNDKENEYFVSQGEQIGTAHIPSLVC